MDRLIDEIVEVKVTDAVSAATATAVNTVAVLGTSTKTDTLVEYKFTKSSGDVAGEGKSVQADFDGDILNVAKSFFGNDNPGKLVCIPVTEISADDIEDDLNDALDLGVDKNGREIDFYHVVVRLPSEVTSSDAKAIIEALDAWCIANYRCGHVEVQSFDTAKAIVTAMTTKKPERVGLYFHSETAGLCMAAALVADRCASDPARGTWAHKTLANISADAIGQGDLKDAQSKGINVYCRVAGVNRTFFGTICGEQTKFVDEIVKKDWLKFRTQEAIFNVLGSANNGDGVDYNDAGISAIAASINSILVVAADNDHRYIMPDSYEVQVPKYADISATERAKRNLPNVKVPFALQGSVHTVKYVELQVVA